MIHWIPPVTKKSFKKQPHPYASTLHISDNWNTMQEGQQALEEAESDLQENPQPGPSSASQLQPGTLTASPTSIDPISDMGQAASTSAESAAESTTESPTDKTPTQSTSQPAGGVSGTPQPAAMSAPAAATASASASVAPAPTPPARSPRPNYPPYATRPPLPDVNVTSETIEDAYVDFIFHCNPHVPLDTDTMVLRDTFSDPPKSGGKSFNTFVLFGLIKQLETKEIKTWAELALKLGVDPPDTDKGESSQKIQQYAVRLKRWMHSMHIDSFFEYLVGREHEYWVDIPSLAIPLSEIERDGVRAEDDMALRALLPHIRPRRGRRKPGEDDAQSPLPPGGEPWSAHPAQRGSVFTFDNTRLGVPGQGAPWGNNDGGQTPMTAYPQSAITPTTRTNFWSDEPRSAITPSGSKPKSLSRRHGAKVVSSAWRTGGATGRVRGRPPINRQLNSDGPFSAFPASSDSPHYGKHTFPNNPPPSQTPILPPPRPNPPAATQTPTSATAQPSPTVREAPAPAASGRPAKRTRLSLQVPERVGNEVRLATPPLLAPAPPTLMVNGQAQPAASNTHPQYAQISSQHHQASQPTLLPSGPSSSSSAHPNPNPIPSSSSLTGHGPLGPSPFTPSSLADPAVDKYNLLDVESIFIHQILTATWLDSAGNPIPACSVDEAFAFCHTVIENFHRNATNREGFLINLAALAGGYSLMNRDGGPAGRVDAGQGVGGGPGRGLRVTKLGEGVDEPGTGGEGEGGGKWIKVLAVWELRLGGICGNFSMEEVVRVGKWGGGGKKKADESSSAENAAVGAEGENNGEGSSAGGEKSGRGGKRQGKKLSKKEEEELEKKKREEELKKAEEEKKMWQAKFMEMVAAVKKRDEELAMLKGTMLHALREREA
ncbi:ARS binding protein 2-domain-containing protein [Neurospora tetraspora]|uniref:ARS binding protein 2-domain-containing protein n=1 Tax=Neurospora tetraspora TaxID=94610 RepID=A0AAE0MRH5_9PEZI|nr:ARS binding protein 2-domain-containing protein [Neurospora tetraspora]